MQFTPRQVTLGKEVAESLRSFFRDLKKENHAIAYSGGLDSTLLLSLCSEWATPYTMGLADSKDYRNSETGVRLFNISQRKIDIESLDLDRYVELIRSIDPSITRRDIGYEAVLAAVLDNMEEEFLITGQGADELFYGYRRLLDDPSLTNQWHVDKLFIQTLPREKALAEHFGKTLVTPYLDPEISRIIEDTTRDDHFSGEYNKAILRYAGICLGLPEEVVEVKKTAAQYGSGILRKMKKEAYWQTLPEA